MCEIIPLSYLRNRSFLVYHCDRDLQELPGRKKIDVWTATPFYDFVMWKRREAVIGVNETRLSDSSTMLLCSGKGIRFILAGKYGIFQNSKQDGAYIFLINYSKWKEDGICRLWQIKHEQPSMIFVLGLWRKLLIFAGDAKISLWLLPFRSMQGDKGRRI